MTANIELVSRRFPMLLQDKLPRAKVEMDAVRPEYRVARKARGGNPVKLVGLYIDGTPRDESPRDK